ncbi:MAG: restriction endonuclease [Chloroflexota bacterium]|nr:Uma2 family endonuclease [Chloroflexota bacterium]NOG64607.1 Uma2 family endonuclease [Chloroflexota bacterium]GIK63393.1 MAG: restriction endonuclease [Chloroflexota bacterium]
MVERVVPATYIGHAPSGEIVATGISAAEFSKMSTEERYEWVRGFVIKMPSASLQHIDLVFYLHLLFKVYFKLNPIGCVVGDGLEMRIEAIESYRQPDLQIILNTNTGELTNTAMIGPADICIEVVSPESVARDYGDKFEEYEKAGVQEYWLIDPLRKAHRFYRLDTNGLYIDHEIDAAGNYTTLLLPHFVLPVSTLWQEQLPDVFAVTEFVEAMFKA